MTKSSRGRGEAAAPRRAHRALRTAAANRLDVTFSSGGAICAAQAPGALARTSLAPRLRHVAAADILVVLTSLFVAASAEPFLQTPPWPRSTFVSISLFQGSSWFVARSKSAAALG